MPATFAQHENGLIYLATGDAPVKRWDGITGDLENAGVVPPITAPVIATVGDGGLVGTYTAYLRYIDRLGNPSNLSPISNQLELSGLTGTITTISTVTIAGTSYSRLHSSGISSQLVNGNVIVITGVNGMTGINGTWYYFADPNGSEDDFFIQSVQAVVLADGIYAAGGTWSGATGTISAATDVVVAGVPYTRLSGSAGTWSRISEGQSVDIASMGGTLDGTFAYHRDLAGNTDDFYLMTIEERQHDAGAYTSGGTWSQIAADLTDLIEIYDGSSRYTQLRAPGIGSQLNSGNPLRIVGSTVSGLNGEWVFAPAVSPFGGVDDFALTVAGVKQLFVPTYPDMTTGKWSAVETGTNAITAGHREIGPGGKKYTRLTAPNIWNDFANGDSITISGLGGNAVSLNGTWYFFKDEAFGADNFYISAFPNGSERKWNGVNTMFGPAELGTNSLYRSPAVAGPVAITRIDQVRDGMGYYTRLKSTGLSDRQDGDSITIEPASFTGTLAELNGTWTFHRDALGSDYFYLLNGAVRLFATVSYDDTGFDGAYSKNFGTITAASNVMVSGVTYTRITSAAIWNHLSNYAPITIENVGGMTGLNGDWYYHPDLDGVSPNQFFITNIPTVVLGTGTYSPPPPGTYTVTGSGSIPTATTVTSHGVTYTRFNSVGIALLLDAGNPIELANMTALTFEGVSLDGEWYYYPDPDGGEDDFFIQKAAAGVLGAGDYSGGAQWTKGRKQIDYTNVEAPTDPQIVRKQILRNANGALTTYYVDIDTTNLSATSFTSTRTDADLTAQESVPLYDDNQRDLAILRYGVPPNDLPLLLVARGRLLFSGSATYLSGSAAVTQNSVNVAGAGTAWKSAFVGRYFCVAGQEPLLISSVDVVSQTLVLASAWPGASNPYISYSIHSGEQRRHLIAWSEAGLPEAVSVTNAFLLTRQGGGAFEDITGLFAIGPLVYVTEASRTYLFSFQNDPAAGIAGGDGNIFLHSYRGLINQRCALVVEDTAYLLDQQGIHALSRNGDNALTTIIQSLWDIAGDYNYIIRWEHSPYFHAVHDKTQETLRWFVTFDSRKYPHFAICLDYRQQQWWLEEYPLPICSSCTGFVGRSGAPSAMPVVFVGSTAQRVFVLGHGNLDGIDEQAPSTGGYVTEAGLLSLRDSAASFANDVVGLAVDVLQGKGAGQRRFVSAVDGDTLYLTQPWTVLPDATSRYQIGAIDYLWKSGVFRFVPSESQNVRALEVLTVPVQDHGTTELTTFVNRSATSAKWGVTATNQGIRTIAGFPEATLDLAKPDGFFRLRLDGLRQENLEGGRFLEVEISGTQATDPVVLVELNIDGVSQ
jgi:hypothetical protein